MRRVEKGSGAGERGFTLIELLIVVAILGALAAVAIPNLLGFINTGRLQAMATERAIVQTAIATYMADRNGVAPPNTDALQNYLLTPLHGTYNWDASGQHLAQVYDGLTWP